MTRRRADLTHPANASIWSPTRRSRIALIRGGSGRPSGQLTVGTRDAESADGGLSIDGAAAGIEVNSHGEEPAMSTPGRIAVALVGAIGLLGAVSSCATREQWADWRGHSSHFASGQHMAFSMRNTEGAAPRVRRSDVEASRVENWWGRVITVSPDQIFQN